MQIQIPRASLNHHAYETSVSSTPSAAEIPESELPNSRKESRNPKPTFVCFL